MKMQKIAKGTTILKYKMRMWKKKLLFPLLRVNLLFNCQIWEEKHTERGIELKEVTIWAQILEKTKVF